MRAALYARTATVNQEEVNPAMALQLDALRAYAARRGMTIIAEFTDAGYSGLRRDRPALDRMRALAECRSLDVLLTCGPERLARDWELLVRLREELKRWGVETISLEDGAASGSALPRRGRTESVRKAGQPV